MVHVYTDDDMQCFPEFINKAGLKRFKLKHFALTGLCGEDAHEAGQEGVDSPQDFGVSAGHARSDASLEGFKVSQDGRGLQHCEQEAEDLQSSADVGDVSRGWLLLRGKQGGGQWSSIST